MKSVWDLASCHKSTIPSSYKTPLKAEKPTWSRGSLSLPRAHPPTVGRPGVWTAASLIHWRSVSYQSWPAHSGSLTLLDFPEPSLQTLFFWCKYSTNPLQILQKHEESKGKTKTTYTQTLNINVPFPVVFFPSTWLFSKTKTTLHISAVSSFFHIIFVL